MSHFILMLTRNDRTVVNARAVYQDVRRCDLRYVGFKDIGLPFDELRRLADDIRGDGRKVMLEVVSATQESELRSIEAAIKLKVDYLLGGRHATEAVKLLKGLPIQYFPFVGHTVGHPTMLTGTIADIVEDAQRLCAIDGVHGLDLLAYRFNGDAPTLARRVVQAVSKPVIAAGSIDRPERVLAMREAGARAFTVGSALFDGLFPANAMKAQIESVLQLEGVTAGHE
ncbi:MAG: 4-hydroxythreonine-4-phosphate dehydrogenase [Casimicrobium sp.]